MLSTASNNLADTIGNTPLIKLRAASALTGCNILGKAEFMNPGGSVKDRTALGIIRAAEANGSLEPGGTIVEGTAGNTGIGLTLLANALGYKSLVIMPNSMSQEKQDMLELYGAELRTVAPTSYDDEKHYIHRAKRIAERLNARGESAIWAQQFDNLANSQIHYDTTGQEIWHQTGGEIDAFICAAGTGGTIAGVSRALKQKKPSIHIALADPAGSALGHYVNHGELKAEGSSITEGIGISFLTENFKQAQIDESISVTDTDAVSTVFDLLKHEGLCLGGSAGINVAGAIQLAHKLGPGHTIVTILCDYGDRYKSTLFNPIFLRHKGLPTPDWIIG